MQSWSVSEILQACAVNGHQRPFHTIFEDVPLGLDGQCDVRRL